MIRSPAMWAPTCGLITPWKASGSVGRPWRTGDSGENRPAKGLSKRPGPRPPWWPRPLTLYPVSAYVSRTSSISCTNG